MKSRFGSCGSLDASFKVGAIGVVGKAMTITTQYDHWHVAEGEVKPAPYIFSLPVSRVPQLAGVGGLYEEHRRFLQTLSFTTAYVEKSFSARGC